MAKLERLIVAVKNLVDAERVAGEKIGMVGCVPPSIATKLDARKVEFEEARTELIKHLMK